MDKWPAHPPSDRGGLERRQGRRPILDVHDVKQRDPKRSAGPAEIQRRRGSVEPGIEFQTHTIDHRSRDSARAIPSRRRKRGAVQNQSLPEQAGSRPSARATACVDEATCALAAAKIGSIWVSLAGHCGPSCLIGGGVWPAAGYSGLLHNPASGCCFARDRQPDPIAGAACQSLGRLNDRALAALSAMVHVPMRRIGFLELLVPFCQPGDPAGRRSSSVH